MAQRVVCKVLVNFLLPWTLEFTVCTGLYGVFHPLGLIIDWYVSGVKTHVVLSGPGLHAKC